MTDLSSKPTTVEVHGTEGFMHALAEINARGGRVVSMEADRHHNAKYTWRVEWPVEKQGELKP